MLRFYHFKDSKPVQAVLECSNGPIFDKWVKNQVDGDHRVQNIAAVVVSAGLYKRQRGTVSDGTIRNYHFNQASTR